MGDLYGLMDEQWSLIQRNAGRFRFTETYLGYHGWDKVL